MTLIFPLISGCAVYETTPSHVVYAPAAVYISPAPIYVPPPVYIAPRPVIIVGPSYHYGGHYGGHHR